MTMDACLLGAVRSPVGLDGRLEKSGTVQGHTLYFPSMPLASLYKKPTSRTHTHAQISSNCRNPYNASTKKTSLSDGKTVLSRNLPGLQQAYVAAMQEHKVTNTRTPLAMTTHTKVISSAYISDKQGFR